MGCSWLLLVVMVGVLDCLSIYPFSRETMGQLEGAAVFLRLRQPMMMTVSVLSFSLFLNLLKIMFSFSLPLMACFMNKKKKCVSPLSPLPLGLHR